MRDKKETNTLGMNKRKKSTTETERTNEPKIYK